MSRGYSTGQKLGLIALILALVVLSVGSTLYVSGIPLAFWSDEREAEPERYRHVTQSDARALCQARAREVFGRRLKVMRVDTFSSRFDAADEQYKIFMEAQIYANRNREGVALDTFINCFTAIDRFEIELFQYAKDGEQFIAPGEENQGLFGI